MGKYSVKGSAEFDAHIDRDMQRIAQVVSESPDAKLFRSVILIGGYARGEGTPRIEDGQELTFNDYDLIVVSTPQSRGRRKAIQDNLRNLEKQLTRELGLPTDLYLYTETMLRSAEFSLLNYEMRYGHKVIWGDQRIVEMMPAYGHDTIPFSEGTRLMMNRGKLLLDLKRRLRDPSPLKEEERQKYIKFLFKAWLAMGDCALLACRKYDISYTAKKEKVATLREQDIPDVLFIIESFQKAVAFKEWGDFQTVSDMDVTATFRKTRDVFTRFFYWYESKRLCGQIHDTSTHVWSLRRKGREGNDFKSLLLNVVLLKRRALRLHPFSPFDHPRLRVYAALPLVLADKPDTPEIAAVFNQDSDMSQANLENIFYRMQARLS